MEATRKAANRGVQQQYGSRGTPTQSSNPSTARNITLGQILPLMDGGTVASRKHLRQVWHQMQVLNGQHKGTMSTQGSVFVQGGGRLRR